MPRPIIKSIPREQRQAINVLHQYFITMKKYYNTPRLSKYSPLLPTDFVTASQHPICASDLPKAPNWTWNQSNAKVLVVLSEKVTVTLLKLSPRVRSGIKFTVPSLKVWIYQIETRLEPDVYFLWCEKGINPEDCVEDFGRIEYQGIEMIHPQCISLQSLSFLRPFVDHETALELGWCCSKEM